MIVGCFFCIKEPTWARNTTSKKIILKHEGSMTSSDGKGNTRLIILNDNGKWEKGREISLSLVLSPLIDKHLSVARTERSSSPRLYLKVAPISGG